MPQQVISVQALHDEQYGRRIVVATALERLRVPLVDMCPFGSAAGII